MSFIRKIFYFIRFNYYAIKEGSIRFLRYYPGHYSSSIPSGREIKQRQNIIFNNEQENIEGVNLRKDYQCQLLEELIHYKNDFDFNAEPDKPHRYYYNNPMFSFSDAFTLFGFLHHFQPKRYMEIGSGYSSSLVLDCRDKYAWNELQLTFIEPYPVRLQRLLKKEDYEYCNIMEKPVQAIAPETVEQLEENDILFVDSSHTLRIDSDLSFILFQLLPNLNKGVFIHFHDIFWPLEYPQVILDDGRLWNESYLLKAFLQYNDAFEIVYFGSYMESIHRQEMIKHDLRYEKSTASSLWLRKK